SPSSSLPHTSPPPPCPLSLHDALPISSHPGPMGHARRRRRIVLRCSGRREPGTAVGGLLEVRAGDVVAGAASPEPPWVACRSLRSEEHTSELQSRFDLVCRLLLEKKKK